MYVTEAMIASMEDMMRNAGDMEKHIKAMMETEARMHGLELDSRHNARDMWGQLNEHMASHAPATPADPNMHMHDDGMELSEYPNEQLKGVFDLLGVRSLNQLLVDIGSGRKRSNMVAQSFAEGLRGSVKSKEVASELKIGSSKKYGAIKFPECCFPVHGDPCLAVHNELGITIHRDKCENLRGFLNTPGRCSNIIWEKNEDAEYLAALTMSLVNEPGALADVSKIISNNGHVEHWLDNEKVLEYNRFSQVFRALIEYSKYSKWENFAQQKSGYILLQDHGNEVSFKNIKIRELSDEN